MADRYWVGGTGTWSSANTANWSASSGGATGASVPTAADNVFFDANSNVGTGAFTVTMANSPRVCNDFTASGLDGTMTLAGAVSLTVSGSLTFQATNFTRTYTGLTTFNATTTGKTITTNGVSLVQTTFNGVGGAWTLGSALSCSNSLLTVTNGTFDTSASSYAVTAGNLATGVGTKTINFTNSTITLTAVGSNTSLSSTGLTFTAGNSTINFPRNHDLLVTGGITFWNVTFLDTIFDFNISGANTFNNLTITKTSSTSSVAIFFVGNQTINGVFSVNPISASSRLTIASGAGSDAYARGTPRTLTCASIAAMSDVDFSDITIAGAHGTLSGTRLGDCGGNSNITFDAGKTVYWNLAGGGSWQSTAWALSSGGAVSANNFPLAQDTAIIENTGLNVAATITIGDVFNIGTVDFSARTNAVTFTIQNVGSNFFGNFIYGSGVTPTTPNSPVLTFANRSIKTINSAGKTFPQSITIDSPSGGIQLTTNNLTLTVSATLITTLTQGTLDLNNLTLSTPRFFSTNSNTRAIAFGTTGSIVITTPTGAITVLSMATATNFTFTGTSNISAAMSTSRTFNFGGTSGATTSNRLNINLTSGASTPTFTGSFRQINFTGSTCNPGAQVISCHGFTLDSGGTYTSTDFTTVGTGTLTSNGKVIDTLTVNGIGIATTLQDALTCLVTGISTLTAGTLDLNGFTFTTGIFSSSNANIRSIVFGTTGSIVLTTTTAGQTVLSMADATNFTFTGTSNISTAMSGTRTFTFGTTGTVLFASRLNLNLTSGASTPTFTVNSSFRQVNFTGSTCNPGAQSIICHGFTLDSGGTYTSTNFLLEGTGTITYAGKSINSLILRLPGITVTLADAGINATTSLTNGTLDLAGFTLTSTTTAATAAGTKNLTFNGGTLVCSAASATAWNNAAPTNFTTTAGTGTGTISMTAATAKTFVGGGSTYNCTLNQGGAGDLTITGSNTFTNITNTVQPASVLFTAGTTSTFSNFSLSGTAGNLITIGSVTAASHTLSKASGTVSVSNCSISYSTATGGATWESFTSNGNVNGGNNTGWNFGAFVYDVFIAEAASGIDSVVGYATFYSAVQEASSGIDSISSAVTFGSTISETGSGVDQTSATPTYRGVIAETGSGADSASASFTVNSNASETASGIDSISSSALFGSSVSETASGVDAISSAQTFLTNVSETGSGVDQVDASQEFASSISEAGSGLDQVDANFTVNSNASETASGVDEVFSAATFATDIAESGSGVDETSALQTFTTDIAESASGIDQIDAAQSFVSSVSETASGQDEDSVAASTFNAYTEETASGVDSDSVAASTFNAYSDESASGLDDINANQVFGSAVAEEASGVDAISAAQRFISSVSETGSGIDQVDSTQSFASSITETASGVDSDSVADSTFNAYADESASGLDAVSSSASFGSAIDENASAVDAISSAQTFITSILETAEGLDSTSVAASIFNASLAEAASGVDSISSNSEFGASIAESASGIDSIFSSATFVSDIAETASGVDSISAAQGFVVLIDENASGIDVFTVSASIFNAAFTDSASGIDALQPNFTYFITVPEGVNAQDLIFARYLWELIDNTETSDWGVINDTQTASWSQIDDTQALNWQNVGNTQTATWSQIDDNESGNWEQI